MGKEPFMWPKSLDPRSPMFAGRCINDRHDWIWFTFASSLTSRHSPSCLSEFRVIVADVASQIVVVADVDSERIIDYAESGTT